MELFTNNCLTDNKTYYYIKSDDFDTDELNLQLLFTKDKSKENILKIINEYKIKDNIIINYDDKYNILSKQNEYYKHYIDYNSLVIGVNKLNHNNNIPKKLLLTKKQVFNLIINEIKMVNSNKKYKRAICLI